MKETKPHGIISEHFKGVGTVTREMVIERAQENAVINGRERNHFTKDDYLEAKRELTGETDTEGDADDIATLTKWDEDPGSFGHTVRKSELPDEQTVAEQLVEEGVNEAEHEQMVEGTKQLDSE